MSRWLLYMYVYRDHSVSDGLWKGDVVWLLCREPLVDLECKDSIQRLFKACMPTLLVLP